MPISNPPRHLRRKPERRKSTGGADLNAARAAHGGVAARSHADGDARSPEAGSRRRSSATRRCATRGLDRASDIGPVAFMRKSSRAQIARRHAVALEKIGVRLRFVFSRGSSRCRAARTFAARQGKSGTASRARTTVPLAHARGTGPPEGAGERHVAGGELGSRAIDIRIQSAVIVIAIVLLEVSGCRRASTTEIENLCARP